MDHLVAHAVLVLVRNSPPPVGDPGEEAGHSWEVPADRSPLLLNSAKFAEKLARALLEESRVSLAADPERAQRTAALGLSALEALPSPKAHRLRVAAHIHHANALQARGDAEAAGRILDSQVEAIADLPSGPLRGDLHSLAGTIRQEQGRPQDALLHYLLARADYAAFQDASRTARALLLIASLLRAAAELPGAITTAAEAVQLSTASDPAVFLCARHNLATYLIDAGHYDQAHETLAEVLHLYPTRPDSPVLLRYRWLSARLATGLGDPAGAAATYIDVRDRFLAQGLGRDAALVSVDLADLSLRSRDTAGCRRALEALRPILRDHPPARKAPELQELLSAFEAGTLPSPPGLEELAALLRAS